MNAVQERKFITEAEYLAYCDEHPQERFELIDGDIVAMAGASLNHNMISMNLGAKFHNHLLESECSVFASDWKVKVKHNFYYPDVVVECPPYDNQPILIVEILSASTRLNDLSVKLEDYSKLPSLIEYVVIEQSAKFVVVYRKSNEWKGVTYERGDIFLESLDLTISMEDIYRKVVFDRK